MYCDLFVVIIRIRWSDFHRKILSFNQIAELARQKYSP